MRMIELPVSGALGRFLGFRGSLVVGLIGVAAAIWWIGSSNPVTPAGYVGYLTQGAVFGKARFYALQKGPTSPGRTWLLSVSNISITPYTYNEEFSGNTGVLSKDNLKIAFLVHLVWKVRETAVKEFVERYSTLYEDRNPDKIVSVAYNNFLKEPLRTYARDEIQQLNGLEIKDRIVPIGAAILARVHALTKDTPFDVSSVVVGNIQYPDVVAEAVSNKLAATQLLERKAIEIRIEEQEKQKRIVQAEGIARAVEIIAQRLTNPYLQHEAIEAQKAMVGSPNHTTIYIPVGPMGVPLVSTIDATRK
jgi:regulator of protease activity HflC (stomatin/prohibitin superfamily)